MSYYYYYLITYSLYITYYYYYLNTYFIYIEYSIDRQIYYFYNNLYYNFSIVQRFARKSCEKKHNFDIIFTAVLSLSTASYSVLKVEMCCFNTFHFAVLFCALKYQ